MHQNTMKIKTRILYFIVGFVLSLFIQNVAFGIELAKVVSFEVVDLSTQTNTLELKLLTKDDFKIYQENLSFELIAPSTLPEFLNYKPKPKAKLVLDPFTNKNKYIFENGTSFVFQISHSLQGNERIVIAVQACSEGVCLLPGKLELDARMGASSSVKEESSAFGFASSPAVQDMSSNSYEKEKQLEIKSQKSISKNTSLSEMILHFLQNGSIFLFPLLFLAGLLTNLTPCVYPMIPITIGVMNQFGKNHKSQLQLSLIYVFGMVITYSLLGVIAAMTGQVFGSQLASPVFNVAVACIMFLLGFAMLDFFDLSFLQRLSYKIPFAEKSPVLAVGTMGAVSGLVAAPCTGPILSMILVLIAQTHAPVTGFIYMLCFALGFGAPYVVLGLVSQKLTKLPKMNYVSSIIKLIFASLMFALAAYYLKGILNESRWFNFLYVKPSILDSIIIVVLLLLFAGMKASKYSKAKKFVSRVAYFSVVVLLSLLGLWLTLWVSNAFVSSYNASKSIAFEDVLKTSKIHWQTDLNAALREARVQNKKILVDVWAEWCAACLEMEADTWNNSAVVKTINENFIPLKLDYTYPVKATADQLNTWKVVGLPAILVLNPAQVESPVEVNQGILSTSELLQKLSKHK